MSFTCEALSLIERFAEEGVGLREAVWALNSGIRPLDTAKAVMDAFMEEWGRMGYPDEANPEGCKVWE